MQDAKIVNVPFVAHFKLFCTRSPKTEEYRQYMLKVQYASTIGSVMYTVVCLRPNLAHSISVVRIFMGNANKTH